MINFNYADVPVDSKTGLGLKPGETIEHIDGKPYLCWHDLIDIRVPLFNDPSILLGSRVPTPLHHRNPRNTLSEIDAGWWERTRRRVYSSSSDYCRCCGKHKSQQTGYPKNIDAHEVYDINWQTGEVRLKCIVPLCASRCHAAVHFGRLTAQYESGKLRDKEFYATISHANTLLKNAGLPAKNWDVSVNDNIYNIPWEQWRLVLNINGVEQSFYSLYKNQEELEASY